MNVTIGEATMQSLVHEFTVLVEKKIDLALKEPPEAPFDKSDKLDRAINQQFDQLLAAFGNLSEHCLPSLLNVLFDWYNVQLASDDAVRGAFQKTNSVSQLPTGGVQQRRVAESERRDLAIEYYYCVILKEVLRNLAFHPGHDEQIARVLDQCFRHFRYRDDQTNAENHALVAEKYAEVLSTLAQSRFAAVRKRFIAELKELRARDANQPAVMNSVITLLSGLKCFRVKMHPIEEFEACFLFLQELGQYYLEVKSKEIKQALAALFVEILLPVASAVKNEVNVAALKNFVEMLYPHSVDLTLKKKHALAIFPLTTCLLCVSQKQFFLTNWPSHLTVCLSQLRSRDAKMSRCALNSLFRLLWVYMVRIKCEKHSETQSKLQSIVQSLFPKGSRLIVPRETPLFIFVKIIHFIAQEKLEFVMKEVIFDLLAVNRTLRVLAPERMIIGIRAFLMIVDSLQQKEGEPPMPVETAGTIRNKRGGYVSATLTDSAAKSIGIHAYLPQVRRALDAILRQLDVQVGRVLMMTRADNMSKEKELEEVKSKLDLFKTCIAAIPRLLPDGMTKAELIDLLARLTVHFNAELKAQAVNTLYCLMADHPTWRRDVLSGYVQFAQKEVCPACTSSTSANAAMTSAVGGGASMSNTALLDSSLHVLIIMLTKWQNGLARQAEAAASASCNLAQSLAGSVATKQQAHSQVGAALQSLVHAHSQTQPSANVNSVTQSGPGAQSAVGQASQTAMSQSIAATAARASDAVLRLGKVEQSALREAEGFALAMLCVCRSSVRKQACSILREVRNIIVLCTNSGASEFVCALDVLNRTVPQIVARLLPHLPAIERNALMAVANLDFVWLAERSTALWIPSPPQIAYDVAALGNLQAGQQSGAQSNAGVSDSGISIQVLVPGTSTAVSSGTPTPTLGGSLQPSVSLGSGPSTGKSFTVGDPWFICLSTALNAEHLGRFCTEALGCAWSFVYDRLTHLFTFVDPNNLVQEGRASSLLRSASRRLIALTERDVQIYPFFYYAVFACCIATPSREHRISASPDAVNNTAASETSSIASDRSMQSGAALGGTAGSSATVRDLFKLLCPLLKCEITELRNTAVCSLGFANPVAFRDLFDEIAPLIKEANEKKADNYRRRRRRDLLKLHVLKVFELLAVHGALAPQTGAGAIHPETLALNASVLDYVERVSAESETTDTDQFTAQEIRLLYCSFVRNLIRPVLIEQRASLLNKSLRRKLWSLFASWSGRYGKVFGASERRVGKDEQMAELEYAAVQAMSAILCCGSIFDPQLLSIEESCLYKWLEALWFSKFEKLMRLAQETTVLLLHLNVDDPKCQTMLDWVIDRCYTAPPEVADLCFAVLVKVFNHSFEYPCEYVSMLHVSLLYAGCTRTHTRENALLLLKILYYRFFVQTLVREQPSAASAATTVAVSSASDADPMLAALVQPAPITEQELFWGQMHNMTQYDISERLALLHPALTMPIFSELTQRLPTAKPGVRAAMFAYVVPWLHNIELIDFCGAATSDQSAAQSGPAHISASPSKHVHTHHRGAAGVGCTLPIYELGSGWGSEQATYMVLNNLFYLTVQFADEYPSETARLWQELVTVWPDNLRVVVQYLTVMSGLSQTVPHLLTASKRIATYVAQVKADCLLDELFNELQSLDSCSYNVERTQTAPFFRIQPAAKRPLAPGTVIIDSNDTVTSTVFGGNYDTFLTRRTVTTNASATMMSGAMNFLRLTSTTSSKRQSVFGAFGEGARKDAGQTPAQQSPVVVRAAKYASPPPASGGAAAPAPASASESIEDAKTRFGSANRQSSLDIASSPYPLPMPAFGGYFAPLAACLPDASWSCSLPFYRASVVLLLLPDLVFATQRNVDWSLYLPLVLHAITLGMDNARCVVYEHAKQLLVRLLVVLCPNFEVFRHVSVMLSGAPTANSQLHNLNVHNGPTGSVVRMLIGLRPESDSYSLTTDGGPCRDVWRLQTDAEWDAAQTLSEHEAASEVATTCVSGQTASSSSDSHSFVTRKRPLYDVNLLRSLDELTRNFADFILSYAGEPLWPLEDMTPKSMNLASVETLSLFVRYVVCIFKQCTRTSAQQTHRADSLAKLQERWALVALHHALSCSSRHFAGRSFEVFRALEVPISSRLLSDILTRLIDTVAEQNEDLQGYVAEIMITLERIVDRIIRQASGKASVFDAVPLSKDDSASASLAAEPTELRASGPGPAAERDRASLGHPRKRTSQQHHPVYCISKTRHPYAPWMTPGQGHSSSAAAAASDADADALHARSTSYTMPAIGAGSPAVSQESKSRTASALGSVVTRSKSRYRDRAASDIVDQTADLQAQSAFVERQHSAASGAGVGGERPVSIAGAPETPEPQKRTSGIPQSRSNQSFKTALDGTQDSFDRQVSVSSKDASSSDAPFTQDERLSILAQLFWVSVALLESDYEYEYLAALRLLDKIVSHVQPKEAEFLEKLQKLQTQANWSTFAGIQTLILKGCVTPATSEMSWSVLAKLTLSIQCVIIDATQSIGFPLQVIALLPYLCAHYERPNATCIEAAENIARMCTSIGANESERLDDSTGPHAVQKNTSLLASQTSSVSASASPKHATAAQARSTNRLENLITVMDLYKRSAFSKDCQQWIKCVTRYLLDAYAKPSVFNGLLAFVIEFIEKVPTAYLGYLLQILHCLIDSIDLHIVQPSVLADLSRLITNTRYNDTVWRELARIQKTIVAKSSRLPVAPPSAASASQAPTFTTLHPTPATAVHAMMTGGTGVVDILNLVPVPELDSAHRVELPGLTMEFMYDIGKFKILAPKLAQNAPAAAVSVQQYTLHSVPSSTAMPSASATSVAVSLTTPAPLLTSSSGSGSQLPPPLMSQQPSQQQLADSASSSASACSSLSRTNGGQQITQALRSLALGGAGAETGSIASGSVYSGRVAPSPQLVAAHDHPSSRSSVISVPVTSEERVEATKDKRIESRNDTRSSENVTASATKKDETTGDAPSQAAAGEKLDDAMSRSGHLEPTGDTSKSAAISVAPLATAAQPSVMQAQATSIPGWKRPSLTQQARTRERLVRVLVGSCQYPIDNAANNASFWPGGPNAHPGAFERQLSVTSCDTLSTITDHATIVTSTTLTTGSSGSGNSASSNATITSAQRNAALQPTGDDAHAHRGDSDEDLDDSFLRAAGYFDFLDREDKLPDEAVQFPWGTQRRPSVGSTRSPIVAAAGSGAGSQLKAGASPLECAHDDSELLSGLDKALREQDESVSEACESATSAPAANSRRRLRYAGEEHVRFGETRGERARYGLSDSASVSSACSAKADDENDDGAESGDDARDADDETDEHDTQPEAGPTRKRYDTEESCENEKTRDEVEGDRRRRAEASADGKRGSVSLTSAASAGIARRSVDKQTLIESQSELDLMNALSQLDRAIGDQDEAGTARASKSEAHDHEDDDHQAAMKASALLDDTLAAYQYDDDDDEDADDDAKHRNVRTGAKSSESSRAKAAEDRTLAASAGNPTVPTDSSRGGSETAVRNQSPDAAGSTAGEQSSVGKAGASSIAVKPASHTRSHHLHGLRLNTNSGSNPQGGSAGHSHASSPSLHSQPVAGGTQHAQLSSTPDYEEDDDDDDRVTKRKSIAQSGRAVREREEGDAEVVVEADASAEWQRHVKTVMSTKLDKCDDATGWRLVVATFNIFPELFSTLSNKLSRLADDAKAHIGTMRPFRSVLKQCCAIADDIATKLQCPFMFVDKNFVSKCGVLERYTVLLFEVNECFETYELKDVQAHEALIHVKQMVKSESEFGTSSLIRHELAVDLARNVYKLELQAILLFQTFVKLLDLFRSATDNCATVHDISNDLNFIRAQIVSTSRFSRGAASSATAASHEIVPESELEVTLERYFENRQYQKAFRFYQDNANRFLRLRRSGESQLELARCAADEYAALLTLYCEFLSKVNVEAWPLFGLIRQREANDSVATALLNELMDLNRSIFQLAVSVDSSHADSKLASQSPHGRSVSRSPSNSAAQSPTKRADRRHSKCTDLSDAATTDRTTSKVASAGAAASYSDYDTNEEPTETNI